MLADTEQSDGGDLRRRDVSVIWNQVPGVNRSSPAVCVVHDVNVGGESPLSREVNPKDQSRPSASL
jgi:hypothetical protein